ncbi:MAG: NUDIX domain-containing protein [Planctomycetota bacterium]
MSGEQLFEIAIKLFVRHEGRLLVLTAGNTGAGDFPGGRLAPVDSLFDLQSSMKREILEELGSDVRLKVGTKPLFHFPYTSKNDTVEVLGLAHAADWAGGAIRLSDEHTGYQWLQPQDALGHFRDHFLAGLRMYLPHHHKPLGDSFLM